MANCFGEEVDDLKLDQVDERYIGKPKTQEDRARVAVQLMNDKGKSLLAEKYVQDLKRDYNEGISWTSITTLCLIYNATGDTLHYVSYNDMMGYVGRTPYPVQIGNGQWAAFQHVHKTGDTSGSQAAVLYRGKNSSGDYRDFVFAWDTPWGWAQNRAYCDEDAVNNIQWNWDHVYNGLNGSGYSHKTDKNGIHIQVDTATGDSPIFKGIIKIDYSP